MAVVPATPRFRRARHLVLYWRGSRLVVHNYATGQRVVTPPSLSRLLDHCSQWRSQNEIASAVDAPPGVLGALLRRLVDRSLLERSDRPEDPRTRAMAALDPWNPEAGFFHSATKDVRFWPAREAASTGPRASASSADAGAGQAISRRQGSRLATAGRGDVCDCSRRAKNLAAFFVQGADPPGPGNVARALRRRAAVDPQRDPRTCRSRRRPRVVRAIRSSAMWLSGDVAGLRPGVYHYAADRHVLERLRGPVSPQRLASYYPASGYFAEAPAHVFLTAVFARQLWRYPYSRAYRAALAEAGHVCQTFCLTATWLSLAPFCLMGLADSLIEQDLGLDGITESVLYAAGVGHPPKGSSWAPLAKGTLTRSAKPENVGRGSGRSRAQGSRSGSPRSSQVSSAQRSGLPRP